METIYKGALMTAYKFLKSAKVKKDDEYYTRYNDVERLFTSVIRSEFNLKERKIYCPCDTNKSAFVQYLQNNGYTFEHDSGLDLLSEESIERSRGSIVITNPPFSILGAWLRKLYANNIEFIIIGPYSLWARAYTINLFLTGKLYYYNYFCNSFENTSKSVNCSVFSNINALNKNIRPRRKEKAFYCNKVFYRNKKQEIDPRVIDTNQIKKGFVNLVPVSFIDSYNDESNYKIIGYSADVDSEHKRLFVRFVCLHKEDLNNTELLEVCKKIPK